MENDAMKGLLMAVEGTEKLSSLLDDRERLRRLYAFCQDAFAVTNHAVWVRWQSLIAESGKQVNWELGEHAKFMEQANFNWTERWAGTPWGEKNDE